MSDVFDRDAAREKLTGRAWRYWSTNARLDALEACVRPAPQQTIDRDELLDLLARVRGQGGLNLPDLRDQILALLRPVDGVTLTREEAAFAAYVLHGRAANTLPGTDKARRIRDLATRLEAAS